MVYVVAPEAQPELAKMTIYPSQVAQVIGDNHVQIAALQQNQALITVLSKYIDYADVFLFDLAM